MAAMPAKTTAKISDAERLRRLREAGREAEVSESKKDFDRLFDKVAKPKAKGEKASR